MSCSRRSPYRKNVFSELLIQSENADLATLNPSAVDGRCPKVNVVSLKIHFIETLTQANPPLVSIIALVF